MDTTLIVIKIVMETVLVKHILMIVENVLKVKVVMFLILIRIAMETALEMLSWIAVVNALVG